MITVELAKLYRRPRTWLSLALLVALPATVAFFLATTDIAPRPGTGPAFLSAVLSNGALFPAAALAIVLPLFLPLAVAVVAANGTRLLITGHDPAGLNAALVGAGVRVEHLAVERHELEDVVLAAAGAAGERAGAA